MIEDNGQIHMFRVDGEVMTLTNQEAADFVDSGSEVYLLTDEGEIYER